MVKLKDISTIKQLYYSFQSLFVRYPSLLWQIKKASYIKKDDSQNPKSPKIKKLLIQNFQNKQSLVRWGEVLDRQFGGSSQGIVSYNQQQKYINLSGSIKTTDKQKLLTLPFIGMLQKIYSRFKIGIFNTIRVQLIGDGNPVHCQLTIYSPFDGNKSAHAIILTSNQHKLITYQLPLRNFQIKGQQIFHPSQLYDQSRQSITLIMDEQLPKSQNFEIIRIAFRLASTTDIDRSINLKKIQLVKTIRGSLENANLYLKPYFYIVEDHIEKDQIFTTLDTGSFSLNKKKQ